MRQLLGLAVCLLTLGWAPPTHAQTPSSFNLVFSTYLGGNQEEHARDLSADNQNSLYVVGGTSSSDFPTTLGPGFNSGACSTLGTGGHFDAFITKYSADGHLLWSRLLGGPCYDRAYAVEVDPQGFVYVSGRAGQGFPTTNSSFQPQFNASLTNYGSLYGAQNGFIAKLDANGNLLWASYVGASETVRDFALDSQNYLYLNAGNPNFGTEPPANWYQNAFQSTRPGNIDNGVMKVTNDGTQVLWATWLGSPGKDSDNASVRVDTAGYVYVVGCTYAAGFPTVNAFDVAYNGGGADGFLVKLTPNGSTAVYSTYIGGSGADILCSTHNLAIDIYGNAYLATHTTSSNFPTTTNAFSSTLNSQSGDWAVAKFSPNGQLLSGTYLGGNGSENPDGIYVNPEGFVYLSGQTSSTDFPTQNPLILPSLNFNGAVFHGQNDAVMAVLTPDFSRLTFSTYLGGTADDNGRSSYLDNHGSFYLAGSANGADWPTLNASQTNFAGGTKLGDAIVLKLQPSVINPLDLDQDGDLDFLDYAQNVIRFPHSISLYEINQLISSL